MPLIKKMNSPCSSFNLHGHQLVASNLRAYMKHQGIENYHRTISIFCAGLCRQSLQQNLVQAILSFTSNPTWWNTNGFDITMCKFFSLPSNIKISIGKIIPAIFLYSSNSICLVLCLSKKSFIYIFSSLSPVPGHYLHRNVRSNSGWCTQSVSVLKLQYRQVIGTYQAGWGRGCLLFTSPIFANFKIFLLQSPFAFCFLYIYPPGLGEKMEWTASVAHPGIVFTSFVRRVK